MSTLEVVGLIAGLLVLVGIANWVLRVRLRSGMSRRMWIGSQPPNLGTGHERLRARIFRAFAGAVVKYIGHPLQISPFQGDDGKIDPAAISSALSVAMGRIGSVRQSGVDVVTAPVGASGALGAVADAVKGAPSWGDLVSGLLRLLGWLSAQGEVQLSGHVLSSNIHGPGLALSLATARGRVIGRETLWATDFEPTVGDHREPDGRDADRLLRLATAAAVWTHFTILRSLWQLTEDDFRKELHTADWRSYALVRVGSDGEADREESLTRALYAEAVDADSRNFLAQFNLASIEVRDAELEDIHNAGLVHLDRVRDHLEHEHDQAQKRNTSEGGRWQRADRNASQQVSATARLLDRDPLCYQVVYKSAAAKLNDQIACEARQSATEDGASPRLDGGRTPRGNRDRLSADLQRLESALANLERTLAVLYGEDASRWPAAGSPAWCDLRLLLRSVEGPMLVLWAMIALRVGSPDSAEWSLPELAVSHASSYSGKRRRHEELIEMIESQQLTPGAAVSFARGRDVTRTTRLRFSLACWYADTGDVPRAMRELELSLESGGLAARRGLDDKQLRRLQTERPVEWEILRQRYASGAPSRRDGMQPRSRSDVVPRLAALVRMQSRRTIVRMRSGLSA